MKIIESEEKKEKRLKKSKQILRDLWDTVKRTKTSPGQSQQEVRERKGQKESEDIVTGNFTKLMKDINMNIQEAQQTPIR